MAKLDVPAVAIVAEHNAPIEMRDGTRLRADVYRATEGGPFPVLLVRTPYGEQLMRAAVPVIPAIDAGFAVVLQHCRGTGTSDGEFVTFENEADDGLDTVEWCAQQPWSNGRVAMIGASYLGMVQLAAATHTPAPLRGMVLRGASTDPAGTVILRHLDDLPPALVAPMVGKGVTRPSQGVGAGACQQLLEQLLKDAPGARRDFLIGVEVLANA